MNNNGKGLVAVIIIIAVLCIVFLAAGFMVLSAWGGLEWWEKIPENAKNVEEFSINEIQEAKVDDYSKFEISSVSADINIVYADTDTVKVVLSGSYRSARGKIKLVKETLGKTVKIYVDYPKLSGLFTWNETNLTVTLPKDMQDKVLVFSTVSGDVDIPAGLKVESVRVNTTSGDVQVDSVECIQFESDTVSGETDVSGVIADSVKVNTVSGDTDIRLTNGTERVSISSVSGSADIILDKNMDFTFDFDTVSGDIDCSFPVYMSGDKSDKAGFTSENAELEIDVDTVSGDLTIRH